MATSALTKTRKQEQKCDILAKVVIVGDTAVGKTNLVLRFVDQKYNKSHICTIGVDFKIKTIDVEGTKLKLQLWDTAGQERFKTITESYYKNAHAVMLVFSLCDKESFKNLENWLKQVLQYTNLGVVKVIVGNKKDLAERQRQVTQTEGEELAKKYGIGFIQTSAFTGEGVSEAFNLIGAEIVMQKRSTCFVNSQKSIKLGERAKSVKKRCC